MLKFSLQSFFYASHGRNEFQETIIRGRTGQEFSSARRVYNLATERSFEGKNTQSKLETVFLLYYEYIYVRKSDMNNAFR